MCRELEASRAETQAAKLATDAVTAEQARAQDKLAQHVEEHKTLNEVSTSAQHVLSSWHYCKVYQMQVLGCMFSSYCGFKEVVGRMFQVVGVINEDISRVNKMYLLGAKRH